MTKSPFKPSFIFLVFIGSFYSSTTMSMDNIRRKFPHAYNYVSSIPWKKAATKDSSSKSKKDLSQDHDSKEFDDLELDAVILETTPPDPTTSPQWSFIINGYCSRERKIPKTNTSETELYKTVYHEEPLERAASLLHSYEKLFPRDEESLVDSSVLEELHILPSKESGIADKILTKIDAISNAGRMLLARVLCSHRTITNLRDNQKIINCFFVNHDSMVSHSMGNASKYEQYFIATFSQKHVSGIKSQVSMLKTFFSKAPEELLVLLAYSPLAHLLYDQFSPANILKTPTELLCSQKAFWSKQIEGLTLFLDNLKNVASSLEFLFVNLGNDDDLNVATSSDLNTVVTRLYNDHLEDWITKLGKVSGKINASTNANELYTILSSDFLPILKQRDRMVAAYNAFAQIDVLSNLAKLIKDGSFNFAHYIEEAENPVIKIVDGHCLLVDDPTPYSITFDSAQKHSALITGANGTGKSIFMNTIGSNVHLALSLGIVPAKSFELTPMAIRTSCNIRDFIGTSLFEAQTQRVSSIINQTKENHFALIVLDEPITATSSDVANAFLKVIIKKLQKRPWILGLTSTHHDQPKLYAAENPKDFFNIEMNSDYTLTIK